MKNIKVKDCMTEHPVLITPDTTLASAAQKMKEMKCGFLPVGTRGKMSGIITDRDIVVRAIAEGRNPMFETVADYMTHQVYACSENDFLEDAIDKMFEHKVSRLVVKNAKHSVVGVLSYGGILRQEATPGEISVLLKHALFPAT
jgi:signal-transduction protein with cAMP-binding, CBS, and nucleotidyltransferase domain